MKIEFKKGDNVYLQDLQGIVIDDNYNDNFPIAVKFINDYIDYFTDDGRFYLCLNFPPVLSHTPYTLNGFSQNSVIEKDTLVWVRHNDECLWQQRFYSHFKDGKHYCFYDQKTSREMKSTVSWDYLETENPLLKK